MNKEATFFSSSYNTEWAKKYMPKIQLSLTKVKRKLFQTNFYTF